MSFEEIDAVSLEEGRKLFKKYFGKPKRNKFNAVKTEVDGIRFDSKKEAAYYWQCKMLKQAGKIKSFDMKPKIELQEAFQAPSGEKVKSIVYIPDFILIHLDGTLEIVDVKGMQTPGFKIKWKLLKYKFRASKNYKYTII